MRGGRRIGAGRKKGTKDRRTKAREIALKETAQKITAALGPTAFEGDAHAYLLSLYKDAAQPVAIRMDAAKSCIGYEKPRLATVDTKLTGSLEHYIAEAIPVEERHSDCALAGANGPAVNGHSA